VIETHHLNIDNCDYNVNFDDEKNPKIFLKYYLILILIIEKKRLQISCSHLLFEMFHVKLRLRDNN